MINNYLKFAWRHIRKSPGYSFLNVAGLAIGVASVLLIFMYIQHELSFDDYHENKDRIYRITSYSGFNEKSWRPGTPGDPVPEFRNNYSAIEDGVRLMNCGSGTIKVDGDDYTDLETSCTESNLFNVFSFPLLTKSREDFLEVPYTAVISRSAAKKYLEKWIRSVELSKCRGGPREILRHSRLPELWKISLLIHILGMIFIFRWLPWKLPGVVWIAGVNPNIFC